MPEIPPIQPVVPIQPPRYIRRDDPREYPPASNGDDHQHEQTDPQHPGASLADLIEGQTPVRTDDGVPTISRGVAASICRAHQ